MKSKFYNISVSENGTVAEIHIYGLIGSYWEGNDAKSFQREFSKLEKEYDRINVYINSPGGSVWDGLPIFNAIRSSGKEVHTYAVGVAMSMGFMILLAAPAGRAHAYKGSLLMAHTVSNYFHGNAKAFRKQADALEKHDQVLTSLIAARTGKTEQEVRDLWMNHEDHFFTPEEALSEGFVDFIEDKEAADMPDNVQDLSLHEVAAYYEERMQEPSSHFMKKVIDQVKAFTGIQNSNNNSSNMFGNKFPKMLALAKVAAANVTADQIAAVNAEITSMEIEGVTLVLDTELEQIFNKSQKTDQLEADAKVKDQKVTDLEKSIIDKDTEIAALKKQVSELGEAPAERANTPSSEGDTIPTGDAGNNEDFHTSVDAEYAALYGNAE